MNYNYVRTKHVKAKYHIVQTNKNNKNMKYKRIKIGVCNNKYYIITYKSYVCQNIRMHESRSQVYTIQVSTYLNMKIQIFEI